MSVAESIAPPAAQPAPLPESERLARLRLARSVNVGPRTYAYLLRRFGNADGHHGTPPYDRLRPR